MKWAYYLSPMSYGQNAIVLVEFLDKRWNKVTELVFNYILDIHFLFLSFDFLIISYTLPAQ